MSPSVKKIYKKLFKPNSSLTPFACSVCDTKNITFNRFPDKYLKQFDNAGFEHSIFLFETLNILQYACSNCGSPDRDRLYSIYLNTLFGNAQLDTYMVLDIAPTKILSEFLLKHIPKNNYRTADLFMEGVDDKVDLQNMDIYEDNLWDLVICSHVLEHVDDDIKALREIYRVLKPGGKAILMAPINLGLKESVEADVNKAYSEQERWRHFGQDDHMRLYSKKDFVNRIESVGFGLKQLDMSHFGAEKYKTYGLNEKSVLYIGEKI